MAHGPTYRVPFRRRREGRTDYKQRLALLKGGKPRAVVRRQNNKTIVQFIEYDPQGDIVRAQATSQELAAFGWGGHTGNMPAAYLTGLLAARRALEADIEEAVLDLGFHRPHPGSAVFAALAGVVEAGVDVPHGEVLPDEERSQGAHISDEVAEMTREVKEKIQEAA